MADYNNPAHPAAPVAVTDVVDAGLSGLHAARLHFHAGGARRTGLMAYTRFYGRSLTEDPSQAAILAPRQRRDAANLGNFCFATTAPLAGPSGSAGPSYSSSMPVSSL